MTGRLTHELEHVILLSHNPKEVRRLTPRPGWIAHKSPRRATKQDHSFQLEDRDQSALILRKRLLQQFCRRGVHQLAATNVMLNGDLRVRVPEKLGGELDTLAVVAGGSHGSAEHVQRDAGDAAALQYLPHLTPHIRRRQWRPIPRLEQQRIRLMIARHGQPAPDCLGGEPRQGDDAAGLGRLGVVLP